LPLTSIFEVDKVSDIVRPVHRYKMWSHLISKHENCKGTPPADGTPLSTIVPFSSWSVPKETVNEVSKKFVNFTTKVVQVQESARGDTTKLLIQLQDGHLIETVIMQHHHYRTVCLSSQIGCKMGCKFCATGTMGIIGNLTVGEIIEQVVHANNVAKIRNVVFMGMGEPLNNYEAVKSALEFLIDTRLYSLSPRHVTVSTVGVIKNMRRLTDEFPMVNLALSLHAPNQEVRLKIVPSAAAHKFEALMAELDHRIQKHSVGEGSGSGNKEADEPSEFASVFAAEENDATEDAPSSSAASDPKVPNKLTKIFKKHVNNAGIMIEYILIKGINDLPEHAEELGAVLKPRRAEILLNLIPYNPTDIAEDFEPPTWESVDKFVSILTSEQAGYRIHTRVRHEKGQDIDGACGQLVVQTNKTKDKSKQVDIEDMGPGAGKAGTKAAHKAKGSQEASYMDWKNNQKSGSSPPSTEQGNNYVLYSVMAAASVALLAYSLYRRGRRDR
jgi:adenine C2-methylase RlmN of 23S rRNA A2503 and tRNA A37